MNWSISRRAALAFLLALPALPALAQEFPSAPIRIVVGFPPGSPIDMGARVIGNRLAEIVGQPVIIENKMGAGTNLAAATVARAPKDGHTIFMGSTANAINATASSNLTFDFQKDFAPITLVASTPNVLVVNPSLGIKSVKELIVHAKKNPGAVNFGSGGPGTATNLALEMFKNLAGVEITNVSYTGSPQAVSDLLMNRIQGFFSPTLTVMPHVKQGKLVALASTGAKRTSVAPDLPTISEAGVPGYESELWFGLLAPAGTPQNVINYLEAAVKKAMDTPEVQQALRKNDIEVKTSSQDEFRKYIGQEIQRWGDAVRAVKKDSDKPQ